MLIPTTESFLPPNFLSSMKLSSIVSGLAAVASVSAFPTLFKRDNSSSESSTNKTILLTNDDGWAATNIRATYRELKAAGYEVVLVAPASQRSGFGGQFGIPPTVNLTTNAEFSYPAKGAPSWGHEEDDLNVWYFNGTPASCVAFGLDYVLPNYFDNKTIDLVVAGPNEGTNLSPGMYTLSGTIGATYTAVGRGLPAIAFSGSNGNNSFFKDDEGKENDTNFAPNVYGKKVTEFVEKLFSSQKDYPHLLPLTSGVNVNFPPINEDCNDPEWVFTRLSGPNSVSPNMKYNATSGLFEWAYGTFEGTQVCIFGDCDLPSESTILTKKTCKSSVSVFSIDYDASYQQSQTVEKALTGIFA